MMKNIMHFGALANQVYPSYLVHLLFSFGSSHLVQVTSKPNTVIYVQVLCLDKLFIYRCFSFHYTPACTSTVYWQYAWNNADALIGDLFVAGCGASCWIWRAENYLQHYKTAARGYPLSSCVSPLLQQVLYLFVIAAVRSVVDICLNLNPSPWSTLWIL